MVLKKFRTNKFVRFVAFVVCMIFVFLVIFVVLIRGFRDFPNSWFHKSPLIIVKRKKILASAVLAFEAPQTQTHSHLILLRMKKEIVVSVSRFLNSGHFSKISMKFIMRLKTLLYKFISILKYFFYFDSINYFYLFFFSIFYSCRWKWMAPAISVFEIYTVRDCAKILVEKSKPPHPLFWGHNLIEY